MVFNRDAPAVIVDRNGVIDMDGDFDGVAISVDGFVNGIVHDFEYEMVQTAHSGGADIHGGPLADRAQSLEDFYTIGIVFLQIFRPSGPPDLPLPGCSLQLPISSLLNNFYSANLELFQYVKF